MAIYKCSMAGATRMERELARVKSLASTHCGSHGAFLSALHEIVSDGPRFETDLATSPSSSSQPCGEECITATELSLKLARLWVERHGRRFRLYRERQDKGVLRGPRAGSENALVSLQRAGRGKLLRREGEDRQLLGVPRVPSLHVLNPEAENPWHTRP